MRAWIYQGIVWAVLMLGARGAEVVGNAEGTVFTFETERMEGTIGVEGKYFGVTRLMDKKSGRELLDSRYSALNLFKLMSVGDVRGMPREMERTWSSGPNWVEVEWSATERHRGVVRARYVVGESAVDLTVTVEADGSYEDYEVFLSSYFDGVMRPHVYLAPRPGKKEAPEWVMPSFSGVFKDTLLAFPRDARAARICIDGRWEPSAHSGPTVPISPVRRYAECLAVMEDPEGGAGAVLMADPRGCYAISSRYFSDDKTKRQTSYSAFDLMLFGEDVEAGDERSVRVRLAVTDLDENFSQARELYRAFVEEIEKERKP